MIEHRLPKYLTGTFAFGIYFLIMGVLIYYFNSKVREKNVHYVKKNESRIEVALNTASSQKNQKPQPKPQPKKPEPKPQPKPKPKVEPKPKPVVKPIVKPQPKPKPKVVPPKPVAKPEPKKAVIKEKVVKKAPVVPKKKDVNQTKPPKISKPQNLFANVSSDRPKQTPKAASSAALSKPKVDTSKAQSKTSASDLFKSTSARPAAASSSTTSSRPTAERNMDRGIENAYLARVEEKLNGWPAQSEFVGEKARVMITIQTSGNFTFKIISASGNPGFNQGLEAYLAQLQRFGFGPHQGGRAYQIDTEFIAKE